MTQPKRIVRPRKGRVFGGVAMGIANYLNIDVTIVRLIWVFALIPGGIPGLLPYLLMWVVIPNEL